MTIYALTDVCNLNCTFCSNEDFKVYFDPPDFKPHTTEQAKSWLKANVPDDEGNITLTGGEPTLRKDLPEIISFINKEFPETTITLLTNGRFFAYEKYTEQFGKLKNLEIEVALNSRIPDIHDRLVAVQGSHTQTVKGIQNILGSKITTNLRYILMRDNFEEAEEYARWIIQTFPELNKIIFIYPRVRGKAIINKEDLFVPISEVMIKAVAAAKIIEKEGIDIQFLHFPFCILPKELWVKTLKNPYKKEMNKCNTCSKESSCPGVSGSYVDLFGEKEFKPL